MPGHKLDPIDRQILAELQADGRMTNVELASRVGISAPPCLRRVRTLEEAGYIKGYHADIDARELGFEVQVFAMVRLNSQAEADLATFEARCRAWPLVRECHMLNGEIDFILKCVAPDLSSFQSFLTEELLKADHVANVKTSLVIRCAKDQPGLRSQFEAGGALSEGIVKSARSGEDGTATFRRPPCHARSPFHCLVSLLPPCCSRSSPRRFSSLRRVRRCRSRPACCRSAWPRPATAARAPPAVRTPGPEPRRRPAAATCHA